MPTLTLTFNNSVNTSLQIGDIGYFTTVQKNIINDPIYDHTGATISTTSVDFDQNYTTPNTANIQKIGPVIDMRFISQSQVDVDFNVDSSHNTPGGGDPSTDLSNYFIMFSKDGVANLADVVGYYARVKFVNNSKDNAELFSVGGEVQVSSK